MLELRSILLALAIVALTAATGTAKEPPGESGSGKTSTSTGKLAANCVPATSATELALNNVRATINTGGDMWWDLQGTPRYEVPKGSGHHALYSGALWLGGQDVSGQLKVAAQRYRSSGNDFWTGPLSTVTAEIDPQTCLEYDKHFATTRTMVETFVAWYACSNDPDCDASEDFPGYTVPDAITDWPAHGRNFEPYNEAFYLAPFYDYNGDAVYNPADGDYPGYDITRDTDCRNSRKTDLYGDENLWWVFNDKGNIHSETGSNAIGMEIRAQAFAFASNDEVANMTFYNYELINRSTYTIRETYFGVFVDGDLGNAYDDFVGCDVRRGLGYFYNGDEFDEDASGASGYGAQPPAVGVDFFEGPYQDSDGIDNAVGIGPMEALNGIGYGDGIEDNERFGMRRFMYFNNTGGGNENMTDPDIDTEYYNYLRGMWKNGTPMTYGGNGYLSSEIRADFMFPGSSDDSLHWGTGGVDPGEAWTEQSAANDPYDRRFLQSAGPFTLLPGAINDITMGVVWARATSGGAAASVEALKQADLKTQNLFDNCFRLLDSPDAPDLTIQELENELILYLSNSRLSNNFNEEFAIQDPNIVPPDSLPIDVSDSLATYRFQGYQVYQLSGPDVSSADLENQELARLVAQCDKRDEITQIINWEFDSELQESVPVQKVFGEDLGIRHSFRIDQDAFATGDKDLVNHKTYYFMAIAYAYNDYLLYQPDDITTFNGQKMPYLGSRQSSSGDVSFVAAIPHKVAPESVGTLTHADYGAEVVLTQLEGQGNGGRDVRLSPTTLEAALDAPYRASELVYERGAAPVKVKVIDPLNVPAGDFRMRFMDATPGSDLNDATWMLWMEGTTDTVFADQAIEVFNEQLIPEWGISVELEQPEGPTQPATHANLSAEVIYDDPSKAWLAFIRDEDVTDARNWIRAGTFHDEDFTEFWDYTFESDSLDNRTYEDADGLYEGMMNGAFGPFGLTAWNQHGPAPRELVQKFNDLAYLQSVDIVLTDDKSKWTRCPVLEMQDDTDLSEGGVAKGSLRAAPSLNKKGKAATTDEASDNKNDPEFVGASGMGWFPGYAICTETGERLNMAFGEDSWLANENGADMLWNPTSNVAEGIGWEEPQTGIDPDWRLGGKHYIIVFRNNTVEENQPNGVDLASARMPAYDEGRFLHEKLSTGDVADLVSVYRAAMWATLPQLIPNRQLFETDVTMHLRIGKPFDRYSFSDRVAVDEQLEPMQQYMVEEGPVMHNGAIYQFGEVFTAETSSFSGDPDTPTPTVVPVINEGNPLFAFSTHDLATEIGRNDVAEDALDCISVVPNPYYAYSAYETDKLDTRVKITNLPVACTISIYTADGILVRRYKRDDPTITSVDWDLKNQDRVPVASGAYLIHVYAPGIGERVVKLFCVMRPPDLDSF